MGAAVVFRNGNIDAYNGGWVTLKAAEAGVWYDISVTFNMSTSKYYVEIDGIVYGEFSFRNVLTSVGAIAVGSNRVDVSISYDYIKIEKLWAPALTLNNTYTALDLDLGENQVELDYTVDGYYHLVAVTCDNTEGWSYAAGKVTFTKGGVYVITVTAKSIAGESSRSFTVEVSSLAVPADITAPGAASLVLEQNGVYTLYALNGLGSPAGTVNVACDQTEGFTLREDNKTVDFTAAGVYVFTITATAPDGEWIDVVKTVTVTVYDEALYYDDFEGATGSYAVVTTGTADAVKQVGGELVITNPSTAIRAYAVYTVAPMSGIYQFGGTFKVTGITTATYVFLLTNEYNQPGDSIALTTTKMGPAVIVNGGYIQAINGSNWVNLISAAEGRSYNISVTFDVNTFKYSVAIDGIIYGQFNFRNNLTNFSAIAVGCNTKDHTIRYTDITVKRLDGPAVLTESDTLTWNLADGDLTLKYLVLGAESAVLSSEDENVTIDSLAGKITFAEAGVYTVTITAVNGNKLTVKDITVNVTEPEPPEGE
jgi:hypothetical protein